VYISTSAFRAKYCKRQKDIKFFENTAKLKYFRPRVTKKLRAQWRILITIFDGFYLLLSNTRNMKHKVNTWK
jgi:hypothetical protein